MFTNIDDINTKEPLCGELEACLETGAQFTFIKHPLVVTLYCEGLATVYNKLLTCQRQRLQEAEDASDWPAAVFIHERAYRLLAFMRYEGRMAKARAGNLLTEVWQDCEYPQLARNVWLRLFNKYRSASRYMSTSRKKLYGWQNTFEGDSGGLRLYRGMAKGEGVAWPYGLSWTLDRQVAGYFANRAGAAGVVRAAYLRAEHFGHLFCYLSERSEREVVINPVGLVIEGE